jgi:molybdopterin converting factor small subunit
LTRLSTRFLLDARHKTGHDGSEVLREMPKIVLAGMAARRFTGGATEFEIEASTVRRMIAELDRRYPGLGRQIDEGMAVAIDGEIYQDTYLAELRPDSEVVLIPKIGGG